MGLYLGLYYCYGDGPLGRSLGNHSDGMSL
jgi:hypothetical protein